MTTSMMLLLMMLIDTTLPLGRGQERSCSATANDNVDNFSDSTNDLVLAMSMVLLNLKLLNLR